MSSILRAQERSATIVGKVFDAETGQPIPGVSLYLSGTFLGTVSGASGEFAIQKVPAGDYTLVVTMLGFRREEIRGVRVASDSVAMTPILLTAAPVETEQVIVTASRHDQAAKDAPVSVATVNADMLRDRVAVNLDDALRYVPGVNMTQDQVNIRGSTGYSRGVGSRVLVLLDGLPYTTGDTGEITWETIPMYQVERVEVIKGAGSALYGSSALGGVINVITREIPEEPETRVRLYSGVYDKSGNPEWDWSPRLRFNSGGFLGISRRFGDVGIILSTSRSVDESYLQNNMYQRWGFFGKTTISLSPVQRLDVTANLALRSHGNFFWWKSLEQATRPADAQLNGNVDSRRGSLSASYREFISDDVFYTIRGMYDGNFWRDDSSGRVNHVSTSHIGGGELQVTYRLSPDELLTAGATVQVDYVLSNIFGTHGAKSFAGYLQDELVLTPELRVTAGIRYDIQYPDSSLTASQANPKIGLTYSPSPTTTLRGSAGTGFRAPSMSELFTSSATEGTQLKIVPNPNLLPERSKSYEVGLKQVIGDRLAFDGSAFGNDYVNLIEPGVDPKLFFIQFSNVTHARIVGWEMGMESRPVKGLLEANLSYTYVDPEDVGQHTILRYRPRELCYVGLVMTEGLFTASVDARFISRVESIDDNLVQLAPIVQGDQRVPIRVVDLRVELEPAATGFPLRIGFNVNNLFNYHYVELIGNLSPPRTFMLTLESTL